MSSAGSVMLVRTIPIGVSPCVERTTHSLAHRPCGRGLAPDERTGRIEPPGRGFLACHEDSVTVFLQRARIRPGRRQGVTFIRHPQTRGWREVLPPGVPTRTDYPTQVPFCCRGREPRGDRRRRTVSARNTSISSFTFRSNSGTVASGIVTHTSRRAVSSWYQRSPRRTS